MYTCIHTNIYLSINMYIYRQILDRSGQFPLVSPSTHKLYAPHSCNGNTTVLPSFLTWTPNKMDPDTCTASTLQLLSWDAGNASSYYPLSLRPWLIIAISFHKPHQKQWNDPANNPTRELPRRHQAVSLYTERWSPLLAQLLLATKWAAWRRIGTDSNLLDGKAWWMGFSSALPDCASSTDSRASGIGVMCGEAPLFWF